MTEPTPAEKEKIAEITKRLQPRKGIWTRIREWRQDHLFIFPSEAKRAMEGHRAEVQATLGRQIKAFSDSVIQLIHARAKKGYHGYQLTFWISQDVLETPAGDKEAIGAIAVKLAQFITEQHKQRQQNEKAKHHEPKTEASRK